MSLGDVTVQSAVVHKSLKTPTTYVCSNLNPNFEFPKELRINAFSTLILFWLNPQDSKVFKNGLFYF